MNYRTFKMQRWERGVELKYTKYMDIEYQINWIAKAMKVFWKVYFVGGFFAFMITLGFAIFGGYNDLFGYVGGIWLVSLPILLLLTCLLVVAAPIFLFIIGLAWDIPQAIYAGIKEGIKQNQESQREKQRLES